MANFSYSDYQQVVAQAQENANGNGTRVGYFRLKDDGDIAIARINIGSTDDMSFASVHTIGTNGRWLKVSCLNPLGANNGSCALCSANAANPRGAVSKAAKKLFIPMIVSYRDPNAATGYTTPAPVIWDRPAAFSRELANKLMIAGDLRNTLVLITRNGKAGDMQTTYSVDILPDTHPVFKPEMIPADFSAFSNFNVARHSYWEKTAEEIDAYLTTGQFPERTQPTANPGTVTQQPYTTPVAPTAPVQQTVAPVTAPSFTQTAIPTPAAAAPTTTAPTYEAPAVTSAEPPVRNFTGFSF